VANLEVRLSFNKILISFGLGKETIDRLINGGVELLYEDHEYQRLVSDLQGEINVKK